MEKISFMRRLSSSLIDKVLILVLLVLYVYLPMECLLI